MEKMIGATSTTVASASSQDTPPVTVAYYPVVDADTALLVAVPIQIPKPFWTSCDMCGFQFEYEFKYRDLLIKCPWCSNPFVAKERSIHYKGARTVERVHHAHDKELEDLQPNENTAQGECSEKPPERQGIPKEASPGDVVAVKKIPDLDRDDFLKAFDILRRDDFRYRMLVAFPMQLKKPWLLKEIGKQK